jgi:hypothetical protein
MSNEKLKTKSMERKEKNNSENKKQNYIQFVIIADDSPTTKSIFS